MQNDTHLGITEYGLDAVGEKDVFSLLPFEIKDVYLHYVAQLSVLC